MSIIKTFINTLNWCADFLFPLSKEEKILYALSPQQALELFKRAPPSPIPDTISFFAYKDPCVRRMVWCIKYKRSLHCSIIAAYALKIMLTEVKTKFPKIDLMYIIPMPITKRRRKERGYNQCEIICHELNNILNDHTIIIREDILIRTIHKSRQTLKDRSHRLESAKGIFSLTLTKDTTKNGNVLSQNSLIIVLDDVITTGSTIKEAMDTFRREGFENVVGISVAH